MAMNELALYRKYRPQNFKEVLGQEQVVKVLQGAIKEGNIAHAYLFAGSRGAGKTSVAPIFAPEIGTSEKDLYEIDAASNRGVDDIRELREGVHALPFDSTYKVYIVDEGHMLTKEAFNAFLKTLEEPPRHALFILATTEIEKLPETIVSRCQVFTFKKPTQKLLKDMLTSVAKKEGFAIEPAGAELMALLADGSFRDGLGVLQKIFSSSKDKKVSLAEVELVTGAPRGKLLSAVLLSIENGEVAKGLEAVREAAAENIDMRIFLTLLLERVRGILLLRFAKDMEGVIAEEFSESDFAVLKKIAGNKESKINAATLKRLLEAYTESARSHIPELPLELALIDIVSHNSAVK